MHYAVNNSEVLAPVHQWHLKFSIATADRYMCIGVLGVYLIARRNSRHKTCSAECTQQSRSF